MDNLMRVRDLSEAELLSRIVPLLPRGSATIVGPGDDCAVISAPFGSYVVTTDIHVENHHFRRDWSTAYEIGERAAAQNLADVVAMGATPTGLVCSLTLPGDTELSWVEDLVAGFGFRIGLAGAGGVGGDLSSGESIVIAVGAHGDCQGFEPVLRSGAQVGDTVAVAGTLGRSAGGLALLLGDFVDPNIRGDLIPEELREALAVYRAPVPPLSCGIAAGQAGVRAMMDISDGLMRDGDRISQASGVALDLSQELLEPDIAALRPVAQITGDEPLTWVLTGGEDHSMLATFAPDVELPTGFRPLGKVVPGSGVLLNGAKPELSSLGWDHFSS